MSDDKNYPADTLRKKAETLLSQSPETSKTSDLHTVTQLAHELAVHQAELELQNEELRTTQLKLQEARDRFQALFEHAPVGYVVLDASGIIRQTNATWRSMLGCPEDDFLGRPFAENILAEDAPIFLSRFRAIFHNPAQKQIVIRIRRRAAPPFQAQIEAKPRDSQQQKDSELMIIISDISERVQTEKQLASTSNFLYTVIDQSPFPLWVSGPDGTVIRTNQSLRETLNLTDEQIVGQYNVLKDYNLEAQGLMSRVRSVFETHQPESFSIHWRAALAGGVNFKGGKDVYIDVAMFPVHNDSGELKYVICQWVDISERKQAEQALRESEERFSKAFNTAPYAITITRVSDGRLIEVNEAFSSISGYSREEALASSSVDLALWANLKDRDEVIAALNKGRTVSNHEYLFLRKNGEAMTGLFSAHLIEIQGESCVLSSINDVTELRQHREERERLQQQLLQAQKMESVGRLAGGVAHDYNNMLGVIIGYAELALAKTTSDDSLVHDLQEILEAARRSADITRQLLAFARKQTIKPRVIDLNETVEGMLKMLRRLIGEDIDLSWRPGQSLDFILMDPSQLDQILANLCVNARDAIGGVGKLTIETANIRFDESYCANHAGFVPGDFVMLAVSDDGCGMDKETLDNLFEPFFTTKKVGEGSGLGLATVYGIVRQNKGFINVYSEPGRGTTFRMYLPRHEGESRQSKAHERPETPLARGETVLIVEDEASILKLTRQILEDLGYTVLDAADIHQAMTLAQEHQEDIHLLITDVVMPKMNGRELAEKLQAVHPDLKLLFMSGYTANVIAHRGVLDEGVNFIQKPFSSRELALKVREALDES